MALPGAVTDLSTIADEMVRIPAGASEIDGYLARPALGGNGRGIIVVHDAFGIGTHFPDVARRFAAVGV